MRGQQGPPSAPALDHGCPINRMKSSAVSLIVIMLSFFEVQVHFLFLLGDSGTTGMHNLIIDAVYFYFMSLVVSSLAFMCALS